MFAVLGTWQVQRLFWKLALIATVEQRVHAQAQPAPTQNQWPQLNASNAEYRHVRIEGKFIAGHDTLVQAVTERGSGFWVVTPLRLADGSVVMINRGFIPPEASRSVATPRADAKQQSTVTGLLRMDQPNGAFLRKNDPQSHRWYSRDVQAIAKAIGLTQVAPYFIDADAALTSGTESTAQGERVSPVGGLTVIAFYNNHLVYALTWYTMAAMVVGAAWYFSRPARRLRPGKLTEQSDCAKGP